jgi:Na+/phosphate symporter
LSGVISEAERLYKIQTQSLDAAEQAIAQSRTRLDSAFERLAQLHKSVNENLNADNSVIDTGPKKVISQRTKPALPAPAKKKAVAKKKPAKRR